MKLFGKTLIGLLVIGLIALVSLVVIDRKEIDRLETQVRDQSSELRDFRIWKNMNTERIDQVPHGDYQAKNGDVITAEPTCSSADCGTKMTFHPGPTHTNVRQLSLLEIQLIGAVPGWPRTYHEYAAQFDPPVSFSFGR